MDQNQCQSRCVTVPPVFHQALTSLSHAQIKSLISGSIKRLCQLLAGWSSPKNQTPITPTCSPQVMQIAGGGCGVCRHIILLVATNLFILLGLDLSRISIFSHKGQVSLCFSYITWRCSIFFNCCISWCQLGQVLIYISFSMQMFTLHSQQGVKMSREGSCSPHNLRHNWIKSVSKK